MKPKLILCPTNSYNRKTGYCSNLYHCITSCCHPMGVLNLEISSNIIFNKTTLEQILT